MPDKTKKHTTITLTAEMLREKRPCVQGERNAQDFLPATLSTNPEENLDLAIEFCRTERAGSWDDAYWLNIQTGGDCLMPDADYNTKNGKWIDGKTSEDPMLVAQYLAWVADSIATKEGR